jgi:N-terminal half of MaoC dehydratase
VGSLRDRRIGRSSDIVALNRDREGQVYPPVTVVVDEGSVERFASAVGDDGSFVPPTWVTVPEISAGLGPALADEGLGVDLSRVLHGEEEYEWRRALRVGETVTAQTRIDSIRGRGDVEFLTLVTSVTGAGGEEVALARSVLIVRGGPA